MARHSEDIYSDEGSVPKEQPLQGTGAGPISVRATPEDMGVQIGAGIQKVGNTGEEIANQWNGLIAETQANQSELGYLKAQGDLKAKYSQYEGLQAEAMRPQYEQESMALHNQFRGSLSPIAGKMFDSATTRALGYNISEYAQYSAGQVKTANLASNNAIADNSISAAANLPTVTDPRQFGELNGNIIHAANAVSDIKGWSSQASGVDSETGKLTFGDTPQAQATKAQYEEYVAEKQSKLYLTAAKTVADNHGAAAAADWAQAHWNMMPDAAKVQMNQYLAPKMKNEFISGNIATQNSQLDTDWGKQFMAKIPSNPTETPTPQKTPLDVVRENEGYTGKVGKDSNGYNVLNGINEKSFPAEYTEAKRLLDTQGKQAADAYADNFYQKNIIDKYDIKSLPASSQAIVADGLVNHGTGAFGQSLIVAAKAGASPQELIDMRRTEYQRLNDTGLPQYTSAFNGWNNRLDKLQQGISGNQQGQSSQGAFANKKDFLENKKEDYVQNSVNGYLKQYPDDYYGAQIQEKRATAEINKKIAIESGKLQSDRDTIDKAIGGSLTKGQTPMTVDDLKSISGMQDVLERAQREQGDFYSGIDNKIAKASHGALSTNTPNSYDAIQSVLDRSGSHDRQSRIEYLSKGLGSDNPGFAISWKDFQDAKGGIDLDDTPAKLIADQMKEISVANGNVDGQGQQRAVQYYNGVMNAIKINNAKGDKKEDEADVIKNFNDTVAPPKPGLIQQLENLFKKSPQQIPTLTSKSDFDALPSGSQYIRDGVTYRKP